MRRGYRRGSTRLVQFANDQCNASVRVVAFDKKPPHLPENPTLTTLARRITIRQALLTPHSMHFASGKLPPILELVRAQE